MSKRFFGITLILAVAILSFFVVGLLMVDSFIQKQGIEEEAVEIATSVKHVKHAAIIPLPLNYEALPGNFLLTDRTTIYVSARDEEKIAELRRVARYLADCISQSTGYLIGVLDAKDIIPKGSILLSTYDAEPNLGIEGYELDVNEDGVYLLAVTPEGVFRGIQTIRQMLPPEIELSNVSEGVMWEIPCARIVDWPTYEERGMMLDVARHFFNVEEVKRVIDLISRYKMNRFHLHLTDDQGWRIEIKSWPDLTTIGGKSSVRNERGGYFTQEDYTEIVNYAQERYITVIPEIDMPGHTNAALASYGILNPDGLRKPPYTAMLVGFSTLMPREEITYEFIDDVIREIAALTPGPYIHIGGDEAHSTTKEDYDYFMGRVYKIVKSYGKEAVGWGPFDTAPGIPSSAVLQRWNKDKTMAEEKNMNIIVSHAQKAYIDMKYYKDSPLGLTWAAYINTKTAYEWDPTDYAPEQNILGIENPLWSESIQTIEELEYLAFPRLLGHAEIGWTPKHMRGWDDYSDRLRAHEKHLKYQGINYFKDPIVGW